MRSWLFRAMNSGRISKMAGIPGPTPTVPLGTATDFLGSRWPWEVCAEYGRTYGGMALVWLGRTPAIVLNDPALIGRVLDTDWQSFYKNAPHDALAPILTPECLFIANGDFWRHMRENSPFTAAWFGDWLAGQMPALAALIRDRIAELGRSQVAVDLVDSLRRIVYDAFSLAVWGKTLDDENYRQFLELAATGSRRMTEPPPLQKLPPLSPLFYLDRERWYGTFHKIVDAAYEGAEPDSGDLLHETLRRGTKLTKDQLGQSLITLGYFGGLFSVTSAVATTLYFLSKNPAAAAKVIADAEVHGAESEPLDYALREAMRIQCPVPIYFRNVSADKPAELGGHTLAPDTTIFITNWLLHRDPSHWPDPERFDPERWANGGAERDPFGSGYYFPFGRGPRACLGQQLGLFTMRLALSVILTTAEVKLDAAQEYKAGYFFAVQHPEGLKATFAPRRPTG